MKLLTPTQLEALRKIDSPTVANAIEAFGVRDATEGYAAMELRCMFPELPPVVGYAITCTADSTTPGKARPSQLWALYELLEAAPKPAIVVLKDVGPQRLRSCHLGDVMATSMHTLGAVAAITDGGVRDLTGVLKRAPGFQLFAPGLVVAHGIPRIVELGATVSICGLTVRPGELLHGDQNGLVSIPDEIADRVAEQSEKVWQREEEFISLLKSPTFTLKALREKYSK